MSLDLVTIPDQAQDETNEELRHYRANTLLGLVGVISSKKQFSPLCGTANSIATTFVQYSELTGKRNLFRRISAPASKARRRRNGFRLGGYSQRSACSRVAQRIGTQVYCVANNFRPD
jgi:hypothetical protein